METLRFGLVGCGGMGRGLLDQAITLDAVSVTAVADVDEARRADTAEHYGAVGLADFRALVERSDVDAVVVATPGGLHREPVEAAAAAGKHVFCEKPLAATVEDCDAMIAAVRAAKVKGQVGQVCRWHPTHRMLKGMVDGWPLGPALSLYVERLSGGWGTKHPSWRYSRKLSGGTLLELNAHEIDWMLWVAGPVKRVYAVGGQMLTKSTDYADVAWVSMNFASGAVGVLQQNDITQLGSYQVRLDCRDGSATVAQFFGGEITWRSRDEGAEPQVLKPNQVEVPVKGEMRAFVEAIRNDTETAVPFEQARRVVAVANAAYESIETGQPVELD